MWHFIKQVIEQASFIYFAPITNAWFFLFKILLQLLYLTVFISNFKSPVSHWFTLFSLLFHCFSVNFWGAAHPSTHDHGFVSITIATTTSVFSFFFFLFVFLFCFDIPSWHCAHGPKTLRMMMMMVKPQERKRVKDGEREKYSHPSVAISLIQDLSMWFLDIFLINISVYFNFFVLLNISVFFFPH